MESDERDAGWSGDPTTPDAVLLVPAYLLVATAGFLLYRWLCRWRRRRSGRLPRHRAHDRTAPLVTGTAGTPSGP